MATSLTSHRPLLAISLKLSAIFLFVSMAAIVKATADLVPPGEAVFFRSFFAIPVIFAWLAMRGELPGGLRADKPLRHVWRGVLGTTAMGLTFTGLGLLPLPEVTAIGFATPIFTLILAAVLLGGIFGGRIWLRQRCGHCGRVHESPWTRGTRSTSGAVRLGLEVLCSTWSICQICCPSGSAYMDSLTLPCGWTWSRRRRGRSRFARRRKGS